MKRTVWSPPGLHVAQHRAFETGGIARAQEVRIVAQPDLQLALQDVDKLFGGLAKAGQGPLLARLPLGHEGFQSLAGAGGQ